MANLWRRPDAPGGRYWFRGTINGERIRKPLCPPWSSMGTQNLQEARRLEKEMIALAVAGKIEATGGPSRLHAACDLWLKGMTATVQAQQTLAVYVGRVAAIKKGFGDVPLATITGTRIERYQTERRAEGISNATINMDIHTLRRVMLRCKRWNRIADDVKMLSQASQVHVGRAITLTEQATLLATIAADPISEFLLAATELAANTGMRGGEIKGTKRRDIDQVNRLLYIRKGKNQTAQRVVTLNPEAMAAVDRMLVVADKLGHTSPDHYLWFKWESRNKFDPTKPVGTWEKPWKKFCTAAGLKGLRFHDLRHTVITRMLERGEPDHVIMALVGHLTPAMLKHYGHVRIEAMRGITDRLGPVGNCPNPVPEAPHDAALPPVVTGSARKVG